MHKHIEQQIQTANKTFRTYDQKTSQLLVQNCLKTLRNGKKIITTALGKNIPVCEKFVGTLNSLGIDSHFLNTNSAVHGDLGIIKPGDLIIMISKSGKTPETIYLAKILKNRRTNNWLLTCNKRFTKNIYVKNTVILPIDKEGDPWNLVPNSSVVVFLIFLQALAMELIDQLEVPLSRFKDNHPGGNIGNILRHLK